MELTLFDYVIFFIIGFFSILGLARGLIGELSSLISWVGAILITMLLNPYLSAIIYAKLNSEVFSNLSSSGIIFTVSIILLSIITSRIDQKITAKIPTSINITLGTFFGLIKGILISTMIFLIIVELFGDTKMSLNKKAPKWLQNSKSYKLLLFSAETISPFTDSFFNKVGENYNNIDIDIDDIKDKVLPEKEEEIKDEKDNNADNKEENNDNKKELRRFTEESTNNAEKDKENKIENTENTNNSKSDNGYDNDQRKELDYLIDSI